MKTSHILLGALALFMATGSAEAYRYRTCGTTPLKFGTNNVPIYASTNSFPTGVWWNGMVNSIAQFNRNPSNQFYTLNSTTSVSRGNGRNETWGSTDQSVLQGAPAIAYSWWTCSGTPRMTEGDVIFDYTNTAANPFEWTPTGTSSTLIRYGGNKRLLQGTATHEFGHAIGLLHVNTTYNVMGSDFTHVYSNAGSTRAYIGEDAGRGAAFLYGVWANAPQDVGVSHWRYLGASGEYSTHQRVRLFNVSTGALLPAATVGGEPGYVVKRGQAVRAEFTYENLGRASVTGVAARYVISTNNFISTSDLTLGSGVWNLTPDVVANPLVTLTVPASTPANTDRWLGIIMDPLNALAEGDEGNNATYIPIRVVP